MNKIFYILLLSTIFSACSKKEDLDFTHGNIDFSYADNLEGVYNGVVYYNVVSQDTFYNDTISMNVMDLRTNKECKFFLDYIHANIYVRNNLSFNTDWRSSQTKELFFRNDSLFIVSYFDAGFGSVEDFSFIGVKQ